MFFQNSLDSCNVGVCERDSHISGPRLAKGFTGLRFDTTINIIPLFIVFSRMGECKGANDEINFQTAYCDDIIKDSGYPYDIDTADVFHTWEKYKMYDITTYRNRRHTSKFTGTTSPAPRIPFMETMDDSLEAFLRQ